MPISVLLLATREDSRDHFDGLVEAGFRIETVANAGRAYEAAVAGRHQVIVVCFDDRLREDRFALCERLKSDARTRSIPILLASVALEPQDMERATSAGVLALALPPSNETKLASAIKGVLAAQPKRSPARATLKRRSKEDPARSA